MDGRVFGSHNKRNNAVPVFSGTFSGDGAGNGQAARNNAASAENGTARNAGIWVSPNYQGDSDWLSGLRGGNLGPARWQPRARAVATSGLRDNEASIAIDDSACPGNGIG
jgi:hypothetical protein